MFPRITCTKKDKVDNPSSIQTQTMNNSTALRRLQPNEVFQQHFKHKRKNSIIPGEDFVYHSSKKIRSPSNQGGMRGEIAPKSHLFTFFMWIFSCRIATLLLVWNSQRFNLDTANSHISIELPFAKHVEYVKFLGFSHQQNTTRPITTPPRTVNITLSTTPSPWYTER